MIVNSVFCRKARSRISKSDLGKMPKPVALGPLAAAVACARQTADAQRSERRNRIARDAGADDRSGCRVDPQNVGADLTEGRAIQFCRSAPGASPCCARERGMRWMTLGSEVHRHRARGPAAQVSIGLHLAGIVGDRVTWRRRRIETVCRRQALHATGRVDRSQRLQVRLDRGDDVLYLRGTARLPFHDDMLPQLRWSRISRVGEDCLQLGAMAPDPTSRTSKL